MIANILQSAIAFFLFPPGPFLFPQRGIRELEYGTRVI
jgi:hypothetical protein